MGKIVDFKCQCGKEQKDSYVNDTDKEFCSCGKEMTRQVGASNIGGMDKWGRST